MELRKLVSFMGSNKSNCLCLELFYVTKFQKSDNVNIEEAKTHFLTPKFIRL